MNTSYVAPERDKTPFHCPHCGVMAQQVWKPLLWEAGLFHQTQPRQGSDTDPPIKRDWASTANISPPETRCEPPDEKDPKQRSSVTLTHEATNMLAVAECQNCKGISIWLYDTMLFPDGFAPPPNSDLSADIQRDYLEARSIVNKSPRGAAALLRLCIEKLCVHLGAKGKNLDQKIGYLVSEKNLRRSIQQALDTVRVIGNEAVHPGLMDLRDDRKTATSLFELTNLIADTMITDLKRIQEMFDNLPESKRKGIEDRDRKK